MTPKQYLYDAMHLLLLVLAAFLSVALLSYQSSDPGWTAIGQSTVAGNLGGIWGAWLADVLLSQFGFVAFLVPVGLFAQSILSLKNRNNEAASSKLEKVFKFIGLLLLMTSTCGLLGIYLGEFADWPEGAAGGIGKSLAGSVESQLGYVGASLMFGAFWVISVTLITKVSWLHFMEVLGAVTLKCLDRLWAGFLWLVAKFKSFKLPKLSIKLPQRKSKPPKSEPELNLDDQQIAGFAATLDQQFEAPVVELPAKQAVNEQSSAGVKIEPLTKQSLEANPAKAVKTKSVKFSSSLKPGLPSLELLNPAKKSTGQGYSNEKLQEMSALLERKLKDFGVTVKVVAVSPGPVITRFEIQPAPGVKASKISNLAKDLARSLAMVAVRVVEVIPGKSVMGIEVPNEYREIVYLSEILASKEFSKSNSSLTLALGHDIAGESVTADLAKMPHLLVAGTTGSGKSVGVNAMLLSLLYKSSPEEVRLIMVDPKMLELSVYDGIPHLLTPVITDMKDAANGLRWCVAEMERRYKLMAALGVRNIVGFNQKVKDAIAAGQPILDPIWTPDEMMPDEPCPNLEPLPYIVVVIDEFADMIMMVGKKVEELIARLAQKARAAGIHLILATQRPSVDIITGLIKANVPTRIAFQVSSRIDSRTILDQGGADQLLGHGDMLFLPSGSPIPIRVHGAFVDDDEVHRVVADWKSRGEPEFIEDLTSGGSGGGVGAAAGLDDDGEQDALFDEAVAFVTETRKASISSVQRKLRIGYNRAARLVETMEAAGVVSPPGQNGSREVLAPPPPKN